MIDFNILKKKPFMVVFVSCDLSSKLNDFFFNYSSVDLMRCLNPGYIEINLDSLNGP